MEKVYLTDEDKNKLIEILEKREPICPYISACMMQGWYPTFCESCKGYPPIQT